MEQTELILFVIIASLMVVVATILFILVFKYKAMSTELYGIKRQLTDIQGEVGAMHFQMQKVLDPSDPAPVTCETPKVEKPLDLQLMLFEEMGINIEDCPDKQ